MRQKRLKEKPRRETKWWARRNEKRQEKQEDYKRRNAPVDPLPESGSEESVTEIDITQP